jgi:hypothetical protein
MSAPEMEQNTTTDFQLHVIRENKNIIDYTEQKLKRYARSVKDPQQKQTLQELMDRYIDGTVAICWKRGLPAWLSIK